MKKVLKVGKVLRSTLRFTLDVLEDVLDSELKEEKHKPTSHEIMCGEKLPFTGKYFIPSKK